MKTLKFLTVMMMVALSFTACQKNDVVQEEVLKNKTTTTASKHIDYYTVNFGELNSSGVWGTAELALDGTMLTVTIDAYGLEANMLHPQHIHGFVENKGNATCPTMAADVNNDGLVDLVEGLPFYGPVLLPLTPFPTADVNGEIHYQETFNLTAEEVKDLKPLQNRAIVLHGMTVDNTYVATLPVACGQIAKAQSQGNGNQ